MADPIQKRIVEPSKDNVWDWPESTAAGSKAKYHTKLQSFSPRFRTFRQELAVALQGELSLVVDREQSLNTLASLRAKVVGIDQKIALSSLLPTDKTLIKETYVALMFDDTTTANDPETLLWLFSKVMKLNFVLITRTKGPGLVEKTATAQYFMHDDKEIRVDDEKSLPLKFKEFKTIEGKFERVDVVLDGTEYIRVFVKSGAEHTDTYANNILTNDAPVRNKFTFTEWFKPVVVDTISTWIYSQDRLATSSVSMLYPLAQREASYVIEVQPGIQRVPRSSPNHTPPDRRPLPSINSSRSSDPSTSSPREDLIQPSLLSSFATPSDDDLDSLEFTTAYDEPEEKKELSSPYNTNPASLTSLSSPRRVLDLDEKSSPSNPTPPPFFTPSSFSPFASSLSSPSSNSFSSLSSHFDQSMTQDANSSLNPSPTSSSSPLNNPLAAQVHPSLSTPQKSLLRSSSSSLSAPSSVYKTEEQKEREEKAQDDLSTLFASTSISSNTPSSEISQSAQSSQSAPPLPSSLPSFHPPSTTPPTVVELVAQSSEVKKETPTIVSLLGSVRKVFSKGPANAQKEAEAAALRLEYANRKASIADLLPFLLL